MNGQYLDGKSIEVSYAYKKDSQSGERHGSMAERVLASNRPAKIMQTAARIEQAPVANMMPPPRFRAQGIQQ